MSSAGHSKCLDDATDFSVWLLQSISKYNRFYRFSLGQRLALEAIEFAVEIQQASCFWCRKAGKFGAREQSEATLVYRSIKE